MNYLAYLIRFLFRIKWWLLILPSAAALVVYLLMGTMPRTYKSSTTIYTGVVSGYDIESNSALKQDWNIINNAIDNLINIIHSQATLRNVSMRLFAQNMMYGDPETDNQYITAYHFRDLMVRTPEEVKRLIVPDNDSLTVANLFDYETADHDNYVYGLFHWEHRHYSYEALSKIEVKRIGSSDMLEVSYSNDDPGIVYNTLKLLNDEFVKQYKNLRFGETNDVIKYFESELKRVNDTLLRQESSLRDYNVEHRVINYDEQTKHIAALSRDFELRYEEILLNYNSAEKLRTTIESQIGELRNFKNHADFVQTLDLISSLQSRLSAAEAFAGYASNEDTGIQPRDNIAQLRKELAAQTHRLQDLTAQISSKQYTKEGIATGSIVEEWLGAVLLSTKSKAELDVMEERRKELDQKYTEFSPIGTILKRYERSINFESQSYLSILQALNTARLRQKNLQMTSATLKIINQPVLPIGAEPTKRKLTVFATFFGVFLFVLGFFILLELLDRTLRDKVRAERITRGIVMGAYPAAGRLGKRRYDKINRQKAIQALANSVIDSFTPDRLNIVNILSTDSGEGKSRIAEELAEQLRQTGLKVRVASWNKDFDIERKEYLLARTPSDFLPETQQGAVPLAEADVLLIEYPSLSVCTVPKELLQGAALDLVVARADRTWKDTDQLLFEKIAEQSGATSVRICLSNAKREVVETFTGMLPPYTVLHKLVYQLGQFGFSSVLK